MSENRETQIMLYFTESDEVFHRNHMITSRTCKSTFEWLKVELQSLNIFIVDSDWLNDKGVVLP